MMMIYGGCNFSLRCVLKCLGLVDWVGVVLWDFSYIPFLSHMNTGTGHEVFKPFVQL